MFATFLTLALFAAPALTGVSATTGTLTAPTSLTECGAAHFSWENVKFPVDVALVDAADPCGAIIADLGVHNVSSITWTVDLASSSTKYLISVVDDDEQELWSSPLEIASSSNSACLNNAAASSSAVASTTEATTDEATETVGAAGAAVTADSSDSGASGALGAASGSNGASALHMNPIMALCAVFAVALVL